MHVADLGELRGEVVLFGGPVSNLQATKAMIATVDERPAICTGDVVAYCGRPAETVSAIRGTGWPVVAGNCERQMAEGADDCGCGFGDGTTCDLLSRDWYAHARRELDADARSWMAALPDAVTFTHAGRRVVVLHGGWTAINRFIWPSDGAAVFREEIAAIAADIGPVDMVVGGHSGIAFERVVDDVSWLNAGSIGLPPHDGRPETRYVVLGEDGARVERLRYDAEAARADMERAGLVKGYDETITTGVWPSEDILPTALGR